jgi:hexosaminidase
MSTSLRHCSTLILICLISSVQGIRAATLSGVPAIIPKPLTMEVRKGVFTLVPGTGIHLESSDGEVRRIGEFLSSLLSKSVGGEFSIHAATVGHQGSHPILLSLGAPGLFGPEGYELLVTPAAIRINAAKAQGLFYGVQTLRQLLPPEVEAKVPSAKRIEVPCVYIQDKPRFAWRGLMLDCSRTFLSMDYLKRNLDRMALYKLNVLHLHLTDDQGWRLEIRKYPRLTSVGARFADRFGGRGGYYSQQEIKGLVAYARERNITIVPEIELPGHSIEVLAAYPELACQLPEKGVFEVHPFWEDSSFSPPLCAGNDKVYEMYQDILSEVIELFPSAFIHVGGDEVPKDTWKNCKKCQARMQVEGLKDPEELQSYFMARIGKFLASKGRRMIGWDEILSGGLAPGAAVMSWRSMEGGVIAAKAGHDVVMIPNSNCYFDFTYSRTPTELVYSYNPVPDGFSSVQAERILGVQGALWTHMADNEMVFDYQMFPRLLALSEVAWSSSTGRNVSDFNNRLDRHLPRFELLGIRYFNKTSLDSKIGSWQASELDLKSARQFEWDATPVFDSDGEYFLQVKRDDGPNGVLVRSIELLEDGIVIGRDDYAAEVNSYIGTKVSWLRLNQRKSDSRYVIRLVLQGTKDGGESGSVWVQKGSK